MLITGYSHFTISKVGILKGGMLGAHFKVDANVSLLFPYINAIIQPAVYRDKPHCIQFQMDDVVCTLYSKDVIAAAFHNKNQALYFADRFVVFINDLFQKKDTIQPDHKTYNPISAVDIYKLLPQTNCKECGFPTCLAFAASLSRGKATTGLCPEFSRPISEKAVYPVFDNNGNLSSTVEIEIDSKKKIPQKKAPPVSIIEEGNLQVRLTQRELEVLGLIAKGATNTQISKKLFISPHTVKSHVIHIFNKVGVNDRTQAAVWAARHNLI